ELDVAIHRAADIEENQHIDLVAALRAHDQVEIALMRGRLDRAVEIEFCRCALARETAEPPQRDLDVAGTEFDLVVEVLVFALVPDLHGLAVATFLLAD